jgi:hypothetical protein
MELFQMPTEESMLQVCSIWLLKMCIGSIVPELETSSKCSYRFCLRGNYLNTPDTQRFSVKGSLILFLSYFQLYTISFAKPWHKRMSFLG